MNKTTVSKMILGAVLLLFTACTQDELAEQGNTLPDGEFPLQIGSVSITAESSEEPWTRVTEKPDGSGSVFQGGERIGVRIGDNEETGIYIIKVDDAGNVTVSPDKPVYWKNTQTAEVTAWYPAEASSVNLGSQYRNGTMTYVLHGTGTGGYQSPVTLSFTHQLAKVRVVAKGTAQVRDISIWNVPMICYIEEGKITGQDNSTGIIPMLPVEREGIGTCWEANVGPGVEIKSFNIENTETVSQIYDLNTPVTTQAGALHTITWTVNNKGTTTIDLSNGDYTINGDGTYYFSGTGNHAIRVTGGSPNIYLEDAQISVSDGNAIDITGGNPTIHIKGNDNEVSSSDGAGIYVAEGYSVTITSDDKTANSITLTGKGGAGIGGYLSSGQHSACGNIIIQNVTVIASSSYSLGMQGYNPGIGGSGNAACGKISITNAIVYAYGSNGPNQGSPAIGAGLDDSMNPGSVPTIQIETSDIYAHRGNYADYIGQSGDRNNSRGDFQFGQEGYCRSSNVYCYTGSSDMLDKTVTYDASGNGTEQSQ